ncbi:MFS transporter [Streptomyces sp. NPDC097981]|uniref:MFS transporter n=1 Tax=Streptomyces sp. NPDC097981 TaxID=3155428 RepID=UPI0033225D16
MSPYSSYTLAFAGLMFTGGALGDRFGHRNTLLAGMALFGTASALAAYASPPGQLVTARAVMGAGAALLVPATMAVVSWTFSPVQRPAAFGTLSSFAGVGLAAGPILAGALLSRFWWGSVFLVNVPVVLLGLGCIARYVPNSRSPQVRRLDPAGLLLSTGGLGLLAYGLIRAGQDASFTQPRVWGCTAAGIALIAAFVVAELRIAHPEPARDRGLVDRPSGSGTAPGQGLGRARPARGGRNTRPPPGQSSRQCLHPRHARRRFLDGGVRADRRGGARHRVPAGAPRAPDGRSPPGAGAGFGRSLKPEPGRGRFAGRGGSDGGRSRSGQLFLIWSMQSTNCLPEWRREPLVCSL